MMTNFYLKPIVQGIYSVYSDGGLRYKYSFGVMPKLIYLCCHVFSTVMNIISSSNLVSVCTSLEKKS